MKARKVPHCVGALSCSAASQKLACQLACPPRPGTLPTGSSFLLRPSEVQSVPSEPPIRNSRPGTSPLTLQPPPPPPPFPYPQLRPEAPYHPPHVAHITAIREGAGQQAFCRCCWPPMASNRRAPCGRVRSGMRSSIYSAKSFLNTIPIPSPDSVSTYLPTCLYHRPYKANAKLPRSPYSASTPTTRSPLSLSPPPLSPPSSRPPRP